MIENAIKNFLLGLVPQFVWDVLPYWPYVFWSAILVATIGIGYRIYRLGGWPALTAAVGAAGVALGWALRGRQPKQTLPHTDDPPPKQKKLKPSIDIGAPKKRNKTLLDIFRKD